jgi:hypothetical protein
MLDMRASNRRAIMALTDPAPIPDRTRGSAS